MRGYNFITVNLISLYVLIFSGFLSADTSTDPFIQCLSFYSPSKVTVYSPNTTSYSNILQANVMNLRFNYSTVPKPMFIIVPTHESHVQASVICCKAHGIQLKVRSGGHDYEGLSYICQGQFVVMDFSNFRSINVDIEDNSAWVQTGATIGEVYYKIAEKSGIHGFPAAWCTTVGVGGMFSGGGIGTLMRKYGLAADNIVDAHMVDANGMVLDRLTMGEDLFWAIRGGGAASFGVLLSWKIRLVQVPPKVTIFSIPKTIEQGASELVSKWQNVAHGMDKNLFIRVTMQGVGAGEKRTVQAAFDALFLGTTQELQPVMNEAFPELGMKATDCVEMSWIESVLFFSGFPSGTSKEVLINKVSAIGKSAFKGKSDFARKQFPIGAFDGIWKLLKEDVIGIMVFEPFGGRMSEIPKAHIPFPHRKGNLHIIQYIVIVQDEKGMDWISRLHSHMGTYVSTCPRAAYLNFRDLDLGRNKEFFSSYLDAQEWGAKYFKGNFRRLALVKGVVDKDNFFRNEQSIPPVSLCDEQIDGNWEPSQSVVDHAVT